MSKSPPEVPHVANVTMSQKEMCAYAHKLLDDFVEGYSDHEWEAAKCTPVTHDLECPDLVAISESLHLKP